MIVVLFNKREYDILLRLFKITFTNITWTPKPVWPDIHLSSTTEIGKIDVKVQLILWPFGRESYGTSYSCTNHLKFLMWCMTKFLWSSHLFYSLHYVENVESFGTNAVWYLTRRRRQVSLKILHRSPADDGYRYVLVLF